MVRPNPTKTDFPSQNFSSSWISVSKSLNEERFRPLKESRIHVSLTRNSEPRTGNPEKSISTAWNPESKTVSDYLTSDERLASTAYYQTYCFLQHLKNCFKTSWGYLHSRLLCKESWDEDLVRKPLKRLFSFCRGVSEKSRYFVSHGLFTIYVGKPVGSPKQILFTEKRLQRAETGIKDGLKKRNTNFCLEHSDQENRTHFEMFCRSLKFEKSFIIFFPTRFSSNFKSNGKQPQFTTQWDKFVTQYVIDE